MSDAREELHPFAPPYRAEVKVDGSVAVVSISGEIDISSSPRLEHDLHSAWESAGRGHLVVDLRGIDFMDSSGLGVLTRARDTIQRADGEITLVRPQPTVRRVLEMTGIDKLFAFADAPPASLGD
jgi:anti-anti-sigma factor